MIESPIVLLKKQPVQVTVNPDSLRKEPFTKKGVSTVCRIGFIDVERNVPLRAILHKYGIVNLADLTSQVNAYLKAHEDGGLSTNLLVSNKQTKFILTALLERFSFVTTRTRRTYQRYNGRLRSKRVIKVISIPISRKALLARQLSAVYSYVALKLCSEYKVPVDSSLTPILIYLMFGKVLAGLPKQIRTFAGKEIKPKEKGDGPDTNSAAGIDSITLEDITPQLIKKYGHLLVDRIPSLYTQFKKDVRAQQVQVKLKNPGRGSTTNYNKWRRAKTALQTKAGKSFKQRLDALDPEVKAFLKLIIPALRLSQSELRIAKRDTYTLRGSIGQLERKIRRTVYLLKDLGTSSTNNERRAKYAAEIKADKNRRLELQKKFRESRLNEKAVEFSGVKPWMVPYLPSAVRARIEAVIPMTDDGSTTSVKVSKKLLIQQLVVKANSGNLTPESPELTVKIDPATAQLLTLGGISNVIEDCFGGDSVKAFKTVFARCRATLKPRAFAAVLLGGTKKQGLKTDLGVVRNQRLLKLNRFKAADAEAIIKQYAGVIDKWRATVTDVHTVASGVQTTAKVQTKYTVTAVSPKTVEAWNKEVPQYFAGIHNINIQIVKGWVVHRPPAMKALLENLKGSTTVKVIPHCFHGTAKQTGGIILTYGFKISGTQVTARSMGDVLYLAPNIDKSSQYLAQGGGFTRKEGQKGIIFMGDVLVSGSPGSRGSSGTRAKGFRWTKTTNFRTEEIGVGNPNKQFIIRRVFLVKLDRDTSKLVSLRSRLKFEHPMDFDKWFAQVPE